MYFLTTYDESRRLALVCLVLLAVGLAPHQYVQTHRRLCARVCFGEAWVMRVALSPQPACLRTDGFDLCCCVPV